MPANLIVKNRPVFILLISLVFLSVSCKKNTDDNGGGYSDLNVSFTFDLPSTCAEMFLTSKHDNQNRLYLYVAAKEGGVKILQYN
jgi:hypothetical protein